MDCAQHLALGRVGTRVAGRGPVSAPERSLVTRLVQSPWLLVVLGLLLPLLFYITWVLLGPLLASR